MTRESGTIRERIFQALIKRYTADQEEALVKIDALIKGEVVPGHHDVTGDIEAFLSGMENNGWIIMKSNEEQPGRINFAAREAQTNTPQLELTFA